MKLSLSEVTIPSLSSLLSLVWGSVVGVDIGTSSVKVVQLRRERGSVILDSYGEIQLDPYRDPAAKESTAISPQQVGNALLDLMHEVDITSRTGGVAISSSAALITIIETPTRDGEQLKKHMRAEIQKYIPVPEHEVLLDWFIIPDEAHEENVFDKKNAGPDIVATTQKVLLVAVNKEKIEVYKRILDLAGISTHFHEIEAFSGARASIKPRIDPVLAVDLGATSTKLYVVEDGIVRTVHTTAVGGQDLTRALAREMKVPHEKAEALKRVHGLLLSQPADTEESSNIRATLIVALSPLVAEIEHVISNYRADNKKNISRIVLLGGGACLKGIEGFFAKLHIPVEIARPFTLARGPMVLEERLYDDGPIFANAIGLALRAIGEK